jgi:Cdc6-like AAA superfamily ATPase
MQEIKPEEKIALTVAVAQAFSPSAPIDTADLFAGRQAQVSSVIGAVFQRGQHVIIFGERGVGKTSLANVLFDFLSQVGLQSLESGTINCDESMDFSSLWHKIFRDMSYHSNTSKPGFMPQTNVQRNSLDSLLPEQVTPDDVRHALQILPSQSVIIIDELDRLSHASNTTTLLTDTIKTLSDHSVKTTLILVGVASSVDELIKEHQSVERALIQVHMPRMSEAELYETINKGLARAGMTMDESQKKQIARLSKGLPHYTHLLGLHAARKAVERASRQITQEDVSKAIRTAVSDAQQSIINAYHKAISSPRENLYKQVLLACAMTQTDFLGYFSASDVKEPMASIMGKFYDVPQFAQHLNSFCEEERGQILQRTGTPRRYRFRFINPLLQPFILMKGIESGLLDEAFLYNED